MKTKLVDLRKPVTPLYQIIWLLRPEAPPLTKEDHDLLSQRSMTCYKHRADAEKDLRAWKSGRSEKYKAFKKSKWIPSIIDRANLRSINFGDSTNT